MMYSQGGGPEKSFNSLAQADKSQQSESFVVLYRIKHLLYHSDAQFLN